MMPVLGGTPRSLIRDIDTPVSFSPDGKQIAFVRGVPDNNESLVVLANIDGSSERVLARRTGVLATRNTLLGPAWSPDGKTIAVASVEFVPKARSVLAAVSVADGTVRELYSNTDLIGRPTWLPDGSGLLVGFEDASQANRGQLWYITYPKGEAHRFTNDLTNYNILALDLTSDGKMLATVENTVVSDIWVAPSGDAAKARQVTSGGAAVFGLSPLKDGVVFEDANGDLSRIQSDGSNRTLLTPDQHQNYAPAACGDGRSIVFISIRGQEQDIWRMDPDGSNAVQLTRGEPAALPECSPDGKWILYYQGVEPGARRMSLEGGAASEIRLPKAAGGLVRISPDGARLAYITRGADFSSANLLTIVPAAGGDPLQQFAWPAGARGLRWAPDGRAIDFFLIRGTGVGNIWRQPLSGGPPKQITNFPSGLIFSFAWSPDGKELYVTRGTASSNIILIRNFR
jgi:Tol biopolymer transport system component